MTRQNNIDQSRIATNTLLLYVRMGLVLMISLYTARVVLDSLGQRDLGIYNTVAGIVMMFAFLSNTMATACQRFFAVEMARDDYMELKRIFSLCVIVFVFIMLIVVVSCEICGIWLLNRKIQVEGRMSAAQLVFQCAIVSFAFTIFRTPYQGMIIVREKMKVYAYVSVLEAVLNLVIAICIGHSGSDRLILYGILMLLANILVSMCYVIYCRRFYRECKFQMYWDRGKFMEIFSFAGWNMIGSLSNACKTQGLTVLLNIMCGNAVVAARYMAYKVYCTVQQFADNIFTAMRPQVIKSYSSGDTEGMLRLVCQSSKFSFFLVLLVSLPCILEAGQLLSIWLIEVPAYTLVFVRLALINVIVEVLANPLATAMQAYGKIRNYHLVCGGFTLLILPISYVFLKLGFPPESVYLVSVAICAVSIWIRAQFVHHSVGMSMHSYFKLVIVPILSVTFLSSLLPITLELTMEDGFVKLLSVCLCSILSVCVVVRLIGVTESEYRHIISYISSFRKKLHKA